MNKFVFIFHIMVINNFTGWIKAVNKIGLPETFMQEHINLASQISADAGELRTSK